MRNKLWKERLTSKRPVVWASAKKVPRVVVYPEDIAYFKVQASDVPEIVSTSLLKKEVIERLLYADPNTGEKAKRLSDVPFYKYQYRLLMETML